MPTPASLSVRKLPLTLYVVRLPAAHPTAGWMFEGAFVSLTRTPDELSIIVEAAYRPPDVRAEGPFATFMVDGPLDFALSGVVARLAAPLAAADIPIFLSSTFDTDYILIREAHAAAVVALWRGAGVQVADRT